MYDIKSIEAGNTTNQHKEFVTSTFYENLNNNYKQRHITNNNLSNSSNNNNSNNGTNNNNCNSISSQIPENNTMFLTFRRRRIFNRQTCLISIMAAFIFGLSLGVFLPMVSMTASAFTTELVPSPQTKSPQAINNINSNSNSKNNNNNYNNNIRIHSFNDYDKNDISNSNEDNIDNISKHLKIATIKSTGIVISNNVALQANKTSLNNINNDNNNSYNNDDLNSRQYNSYIPKHPASDFPTIYELKQQQQQQQLKQQQQIDLNNRNGDTQEILLNNAASDITSNSNGFSVTFVKEKKLPVEEMFRNAFHLEQDKSSIDTMILKKLNDANDGSIKELFKQQQHTENGIKHSKRSNQHHTSSIEEILLNNHDIIDNDNDNDDNIDDDDDNINIGNSADKVNSSFDNNKKSSIIDNDNNDDDYKKLDQLQQQKNTNSDGSVNFVTVKLKNSIKKSSHSLNSNSNDFNHHNQHNHHHHDHHNNNDERDQYEKHNFIKNDIYWGDLVENAIPKGYNHDDIDNWNYYVQNIGIVKTLENGCGRMQNRLVIFNDGKRACARYRQNTDQIQGELFSFYLGQLLNLTNLAPSAASVIDFKIDTWSFSQQDLQNAQWKQTRPVVLTKWLPDLEPAGIPIPFQPLERHLNKYDVWNITLSTMMESKKMLINEKEQQQQQQQHQQQQKIHFEQENEKQIKDIQKQQQEENEHNHHQDDRKLPQQQQKYHENLNNKILNKYHYIQQQQQQQQEKNEYQQNIQKQENEDDEKEQEQIENKKGLLELLGVNHFNNNNQSSSKSADTIISFDTNIESLINHSSNNNRKNNNNNNNNSYSDLIDLKKSNKSITIKQDNNNNNINNQKTIITKRLIELAQWSDLIIFDYLIANLDRVVNNLYNYQWNSEIMAAPAHNLAQQIDSQLLIFLDNESGLLHGYRLLKKYEAYHSLLLDNLCVFREPTIIALKHIKEIGPGQLLQEIFEQSTSHQLRDVLPSLPVKSIKILNDRIDRVLGQVEKCQNLFSNR